jgi:hypothetical protein
MQTSIRVEAENRDALAEVAREMGGVSLDEALRALLWQRRALADAARLEVDPAGLRAYHREAREWAELDTTVEE